MNRRIKNEIREWAESLAIALILAMFIRTFFIQAFKIPSGSMIPTFMIGDKIFVNKLLYGPKVPFTDIRLPAIRGPRRGDIVVFVYPEDRKKAFIKRVAALGGETIEIRKGALYVNGEPIDGPQTMKAIYYYNDGQFGGEGGAVTVPEGSYFVLGDNSASSKDSRYWGFVSHKNDLIGRAMLIWWPLSRMQLLQ